MVEIREETSDTNTSSNNSTSNDNGSSTSQRPSSNQSPMTYMDFAKANFSDVVCFVLRMATIYFAFGYVFPFSSPLTQMNSYVKAFVAAAATNAFRLHQRLKGSNNSMFSRNFLMDIMFEDSAHYLFYCLIFAFSSPVTMALVPTTLYALLHIVNFGIKMETAVGRRSHPLVLKASQLTNRQNTSNLLSMIACAEIAVMPIFIAMIFVGKATIFFPFIYYRFISMRYLSRRNPYTRETFASLKMALFRAASHNACPTVARTVIYKAVVLAERLCPHVY